jgi:dipeptidyl aminopeptidase/acylaminoacyl peptidase
MFSVNNHLGEYEMEDQISVAKYLINKYKFIDSTRVGIWGKMTIKDVRKKSLYICI